MVIKYPIGISVFAENLPLKLFPAAVANADIGSLKSLHTLFDKYLNHINTLHEILSFLTKNQVFKNYFWYSIDTILEDVPEAETIV